MSEIKSNKISPRKGTTTTIGDSGDSVTISSGTITTNAGTISTAGITGGTINNTTGTITGLQQAINWQTGDIKTASFTASANEGYFLNTTSGQITVTLPASPSAGDVVAVKDYADTFDTNKAILNANGNKIQGSTTNFDITVEGTAAILLYVDSTKGWLLVDQSKAADISENQTFIVATGGTIATCGDFKTHTFTSPGTFTVCSIGNPAGGPNAVDYLVVAGGGGGGGSPSPAGNGGGGGGAGGFRLSNVHNLPAPLTSPLANPTGITVTATSYPITVGGGGTAGPSGTAPGANAGRGNNSVFSTITSTGGGGGAANPIGSTAPTQPGGSGGGSSQQQSPGAGNTPPVSPPQGNSSTPAAPPNAGGSGGGGAGGSNPSAKSPASAEGTPGGCGSFVSPALAPSVGSSGPVPGTKYFSGGGAGGGQSAKGGDGRAGGGSGGGAPRAAGNGTSNTGSGGGAGGFGGVGGTGGSGVVIIRYKFQ
jgi:hypothetical protein